MNPNRPSNLKTCIFDEKSGFDYRGKEIPGDLKKIPDQGKPCPDDLKKIPDQGNACPDDLKKIPDQGNTCPDDLKKIPDQEIINYHYIN